MTGYFVQSVPSVVKPLEMQMISEEESKIPESEEFVCGKSEFYEEREKSEDENKLLKYWEKHIIPKVEDYVRGSFKDYEMENFFAQLRQPLYSKNQAEAINIVYIICANRIPENVSFPDSHRDWSTLFFDEISPGQHVFLTKKAAQSNTFISSMIPYLEEVGRVRSLNPKTEKVLVEFYNPSSCLLKFWWVDPDYLKNAAPFYMSSLSGWIEQHSTQQDCLNRLHRHISEQILNALVKNLFMK